MQNTCGCNHFTAQKCSAQCLGHHQVNSLGLASCILFQIKNWSHIANHLVFVDLLLLGRPSSKSRRLRRLRSDRDEIWQEFLQVSAHQLTKSDFRFDVILSRRWSWRHFTQKSAATWWINSAPMQQRTTVPDCIRTCSVKQASACSRYKCVAHDGCRIDLLHSHDSQVA